MALPTKEQMLYSQLMFADSIMDYINSQIGHTKLETYQIYKLTGILQYNIKALQQEMSMELSKEEPKIGRQCY